MLPLCNAQSIHAKTISRKLLNTLINGRKLFFKFSNSLGKRLAFCHKTSVLHLFDLRLRK